MRLRTLKSVSAQRREKRKIYKNAEILTPVKSAEDDGIFKGSDNAYSKMIRFSNLNYSILNNKEKEDFIIGWCEIINAFMPGAAYKISIVKNKINDAAFKDKILMDLKADDLTFFRSCYNNMLKQKAQQTNFIKQELYLTISITGKDLESARTFLNRSVNEISIKMKSLGSVIEEVGTKERLEILYDLYHIGGEESFSGIDIDRVLKSGHHLKDIIMPDNAERQTGYMKIGDKYARALYFSPVNYPTYLKDDILSELCNINKTMLISFDLVPLLMEEALKLVDGISLGLETDVSNWQRRQNQNNNFSAVLPFTFENRRKELDEYYNDLNNRNQRMYLGLVTVLHFADTLDELDSDTDTLKRIAQSKLVKLVTLTYEQADGICTCIPFGVNRFLDGNAPKMKTFTSEGVAAHTPFSVQEISHKNGIYYGTNPTTGNMILVNRKSLQNGNGIFLGVSGSGKSFAVKKEILNIFLSTDDDVIIIDPESEFSPLIKALGGEVAVISTDGRNHINALEMNATYGEEKDPFRIKSDFVLSMCEQLMGSKAVGLKEKSLIDQCMRNIFEGYIRSGYKGRNPTLVDLREELLQMKNPLADDLALQLRLFTVGSQDTFAHETNVDIKNRLTCYDIKDLGENMKTMGMLIIMDNILNRISKNRAEGRNTWVYVDEFYLMLRQEYTAAAFEELWKRIRKYGGFCTGITQNVSDMLGNPMARNMLSNSEFLVLLNQSGNDREDLAELLNINDMQIKYISNVQNGCGLMKVGDSLIPFADNFPKDNPLYRYMTTKLDEIMEYEHGKG
ncbi:MAG: TraE family protein [Clostridiales bacterium]|nr:TraE family protein [Clostridiales bacterium]